MGRQPIYAFVKKTCDRRGQNRQRGATLTSYALIVAAMTVMSIGAIKSLERSSGEYLADTGDAVSEPRLSAAQAAAAAGVPSGGGPGGGTPTPPLPPGSNWPSGDPTPAGVPLPTVEAGDGIIPWPEAGLPASGDLGSNGPWDSDADSFMFVEGSWTLTSDLTVGGFPTIPAGTTLCSYYFHYSPATNESGTTPTTYGFAGNNVLAVATSSSQLNATDDDIAVTGPSSGALESNDIVSVSGDQVTFTNQAVPNGVDHARVLTDCTPPAPPAPPIFVDLEVGTIYGKCLEHTGGKVEQFPCDGSPDQTISAYGTWPIMEIKFANGDCFGVNGSDVEPQPCDGTDSQKWERIQGPLGPPELRAWRNVDSGLCLDVEGATGADGADLIVHPCKPFGDTDNQKFTIA